MSLQFRDEDVMHETVKCLAQVQVDEADHSSLIHQRCNPRGVENKADVVVGVYYPSPSQDDSTDELCYRQLGEISGSVALVLMGVFNSPGIDWEYHTAVTSKSGKFLKFVEDDNFLSQVSVSQLEKVPS
ncbi:hypothetical protein GRJ2_003403300 [Grus japonensis]|uniref:Uncharacterized protein n=1 Tax=Grus japonensis TaxID=30415 RepID=A0ABC9YHK6_GRUJA